MARWLQLLTERLVQFMKQAAEDCVHGVHPISQPKHETHGPAVAHRSGQDPRQIAHQCRVGVALRPTGQLLEEGQVTLLEIARNRPQQAGRIPEVVVEQRPRDADFPGQISGLHVGGDRLIQCPDGGRQHPQSGPL